MVFMESSVRFLVLRSKVSPFNAPRLRCYHPGAYFPSRLRLRACYVFLLSVSVGINLIRLIRVFLGQRSSLNEPR